MLLPFLVDSEPLWDAPKTEAERLAAQITNLVRALSTPLNDRPASNVQAALREYLYSDDAVDHHLEACIQDDNDIHIWNVRPVAPGLPPPDGHLDLIGFFKMLRAHTRRFPRALVSGDSAKAYLNSISNLASTIHRDNITQQSASNLVNAQARFHHLGRFVVSDTAFSWLRGAGVNVQPTAAEAHAHPAHKNYEIGLLNSVDQRLDAGYSVYYTKESKRVYMPNAGPILNARHTGLDSLRYGSKVPSDDPPRCETAHAFMHDALMYYDPAKIAGLFEDSPKLTHLLASVVLPAESVHGLESFLPWLYKHSVEKDLLRYEVEGKQDGAYQQPLSAAWTLQCRNITGPGINISCHIVATAGPFHLLLFLRDGPADQVSTRSFDSPDCVELPQPPGRSFPLRHRLVPREVYNSLFSYVRSTRSLRETDPAGFLRSAKEKASNAWVAPEAWDYLETLVTDTFQLRGTARFPLLAGPIARFRHFLRMHPRAVKLGLCLGAGLVTWYGWRQSVRCVHWFEDEFQYELAKARGETGLRSWIKVGEITFESIYVRGIFPTLSSNFSRPEGRAMRRLKAKQTYQLMSMFPRFFRMSRWRAAGALWAMDWEDFWINIRAWVPASLWTLFTGFVYATTRSIDEVEAAYQKLVHPKRWQCSLPLSTFRVVPEVVSVPPVEDPVAAAPKPLFVLPTPPASPPPMSIPDAPPPMVPPNKPDANRIPSPPLYPPGLPAPAPTSRVKTTVVERKRPNVATDPWRGFDALNVSEPTGPFSRATLGEHLATKPVVFKDAPTAAEDLLELDEHDVFTPTPPREPALPPPNMPAPSVNPLDVPLPDDDEEGWSDDEVAPPLPKAAPTIVVPTAAVPTTAVPSIREPQAYVDRLGHLQRPQPSAVVALPDVTSRDIDEELSEMEVMQQLAPHLSETPYEVPSRLPHAFAGKPLVPIAGPTPTIEPIEVNRLTLANDPSASGPSEVARELFPGAWPENRGLWQCRARDPDVDVECPEMNLCLLEALTDILDASVADLWDELAALPRSILFPPTWETDGLSADVLEYLCARRRVNVRVETTSGFSLDYGVGEPVGTIYWTPYHFQKVPFPKMANKLGARLPATSGTRIHGAGKNLASSHTAPKSSTCLALEKQILDFEEKGSSVLTAGFLPYRSSPQRAKNLISNMKNGFEGILAQTIRSKPQVPKDFMHRVDAMLDGACDLPGRRVHVMLIEGFAGSGKSHPIKQVLKETEVSYRVSVPTTSLRHEWKDDLALKETQTWRLGTWETSLMKTTRAIVVDEIYRMPRGYLDLLIHMDPSLDTIVLLGDPCQGSYVSTNVDSSNVRLVAEDRYLRPLAQAYQGWTHRLSLHIAALLSVPTSSTEPGCLRFLQYPHRSLPVLVASRPNVEAAASCGYAALTCASSQGRTFNCPVTLWLDKPLVLRCSDNVLLVAMTRSRKGVLLVGHHTLAHSCGNTNMRKALFRGEKINYKLVFAEELESRTIIDAPLPRAQRDLLFGLVRSGGGGKFKTTFHQEKSVLQSSNNCMARKQRMALSASGLWRVGPNHTRVDNPMKRFDPLDEASVIRRERVLRSDGTSGHVASLLAVPESRKPLHTALSTCLPSEVRVSPVHISSTAISPAYITTSLGDYFRFFAQARDRSELERWHRGQQSQQFPDLNMEFEFGASPPQMMAATHSASDRTLLPLSLPTRVRFRHAWDAPFQPAAVGYDLWHAHCRMYERNPAAVCEFRPALFAECINLNDFNSIDKKTAAYLHNNSDRSDPDWRHTFVRLFVKSQQKINTGSIGGFWKACQTLMCTNDLVVLLFGPVVKYLEALDREDCPARLFVYAGHTPSEMSVYAQQHIPPSAELVSNDYTSFDQSQGYEAQTLEQCRLRYAGFSDDVISWYTHWKTNLESKYGPLRSMRFTGEPGTYRFNTDFNLATLACRFDLTRAHAIFVSGDDSLIAAPRVLDNPVWESVSRNLPLRFKIDLSERQAFCGSYLSHLGAVRVPHILAAKLAIATANGEVDEVIESYTYEFAVGHSLGDAAFSHLPSEDQFIQSALFGFFSHQRNKALRALLVIGNVPAAPLSWLVKHHAWADRPTTFSTLSKAFLVAYLKASRLENLVESSHFSPRPQVYRPNKQQCPPKLSPLPLEWRPASLAKPKASAQALQTLVDMPPALRGPSPPPATWKWRSVNPWASSTATQPLGPSSPGRRSAARSAKGSPLFSALYGSSRPKSASKSFTTRLITSPLFKSRGPLPPPPPPKTNFKGFPLSKIVSSEALSTCRRLLSLSLQPASKTCSKETSPPSTSLESATVSSRRLQMETPQWWTSSVSSSSAVSASTDSLSAPSDSRAPNIFLTILASSSTLVNKLLMKSSS
jgi:hypothetical protein